MPAAAPRPTRAERQDGWTRNFSIRAKLAIPVAVDVLVLGGVSLRTVLRVRNVREEVGEIAHGDIPLTKALP